MRESKKVRFIYAGNGGTAVRVYGGKPAFHAHLIEYGHIIRNEKDGAELGFAPGRHVFEEARTEFDGKFTEDIEKFLDELVNKL